MVTQRDVPNILRKKSNINEMEIFLRGCPGVANVAVHSDLVVELPRVLLLTRLLRS